MKFYFLKKIPLFCPNGANLTLRRSVCHFQFLSHLSVAETIIWRSFFERRFASQRAVGGREHPILAREIAAISRRKKDSRSFSIERRFILRNGGYSG